MSIEAMKQALEKATEVMEAACIRVDELKAENESLRQAIAEAEKHTLSSRINDARVHAEYDKQRDAARKLIEAEKHEVSQEPVAQQNVCIECQNADSWGLPDKPICRECVRNSEWQPLNASSVNHLYTNPPVLQGHEPKREPLTDEEFISMIDSDGIRIDPVLAFEIKEIVETAHGIKE